MTIPSRIRGGDGSIRARTFAQAPPGYAVRSWLCHIEDLCTQALPGHEVSTLVLDEISGIGRPLFPSSALLPQLAHRQHKAWQGRIAVECGGIIEHFDRLAWAVDVHSLVDGIDQPAEVRTIVYVLLHLIL